MDDAALQRGREHVLTFPAHMHAALEVALQVSKAEFRDAPPARLDIELHLDLLASLFRVEGTGDAFVRAYLAANAGGAGGAGGSRPRNGAGGS